MGNGMGSLNISLRRSAATFFPKTTHQFSSDFSRLRSNWWEKQNSVGLNFRFPKLYGALLIYSLSRVSKAFPKFILAGDRIAARETRAEVEERSRCAENSNGRASSIDIASTMAGEGNVNEASNRAAWNEMQKAFLVELLVEFNRPGSRLQNAWSSVAWNEMTRKFKEKFIDSNFSVKQLKEQERTLKKQYKTVNRLRDQSGFGWDPTRKMVDAPEDVWAPILQIDKEAIRWYNKSFPYYDDLHNLYSGCIANGSYRRGSNYFANSENQAEMNSPSPTIPAPGGLNDFEIDDDFLGTQTFDHTYTQAQGPSSTQAIPNVHTPRSIGVSSSSKTIQKKKRKVMSEFHENYLEYKREELAKYCAVMEKNANKSVERADKFSVVAAMEAYEQLPDFDMLDFVNASDMFIKKAETREAFLTVSEERRSEWIKRMIELWKSN